MATARVRTGSKSMRSAWPARPPRLTAWSMPPLSTPTKRSARAQSSMRFARGTSNPFAVSSASVVATTIADEDESPAAIGTSPRTQASMPRFNAKRADSSRAAAFA